jgi:NADH-quinone oxidoreductase subunit L
MFLACGVGAFGAAIFHLMTHAFFKALLFLGAGSVIHGMNGVQDMRKMGALRREMPWTFWTFLTGSVALAGIPPLAGFFSKDAILWAAWSHGTYGKVLWTAGVLTAGLTAFYVFRLVILTFFGSPRYTAREVPHVHESPSIMLVPLAILAALSLVAGFAGVPEALGGSNRFEHFLEPLFAGVEETAHASVSTEILVMALSVGAGIVGLGLACLFYRQGSTLPDRVSQTLPMVDRAIRGKYYVDELYDRVFVSPTVGASRGILWGLVDTRLIDGAVNGVGLWVKTLASGLRHMQSGYVRTYAAWIVVGTLVIVAWLVRG